MNFLKNLKKDNTETKQIDDNIVEKNHKTLLILTITAIAILVVLFITTGFALFNIPSTKIMSNIKINNIDVSGLTKEEAITKINSELEKNINNEIVFKDENGIISTITLAEIETTYDIQKAVDDAYNVGREGNIFKNNFRILRSKFSQINIVTEAKYNEELLNSVLEDINLKIPNAVEQSSYQIKEEEEKLVITKGKPGKSIEKETVKKEIIDRIYNIKNEEILLPIIDSNPKEIDIDKIYAEVHKEAKNAYYTKDPFQIFPHENGIDFDLDAAKEILKEEKDEYEIPITVTKPEITTDKIGTEAFPDLLSSFSTKYDASNINRSNNLMLAAKAINGTVVMPGETFSYNRVVGERTTAKGYREANGFSGGKVVGMIGGGICQIASTLYDAAVFANLEITDRTNHVFDPSYVAAGKDATVVYGAIDFKFKNTRNNPIMIKMSVSNGIAKAEIYGIKESIEYEISIESTVLEYIPSKTVYETDNSLAPGQEKVYQRGMKGMKSVAYKVTKLDGKEISRTVLSRDTYQAMNTIILRGPAGETTVAPSTPEVPANEPVQPSTPEIPVTPEPETPQEPVQPEEPQNTEPGE